MAEEFIESRTRRVDVRLMELDEDGARPIAIQYGRDLDAAERKLVQRSLDEFVDRFRVIDGNGLIELYRGCRWVSDAELYAWISFGLHPSNVLNLEDAVVDPLQRRDASIFVTFTVGDSEIAPPETYELTARATWRPGFSRPTEEQLAASRALFLPTTGRRTQPSEFVTVGWGSSNWESALGFRLEFDRAMSEPEQQRISELVERWRREIATDDFEPGFVASWSSASSFTVVGSFSADGERKYDVGRDFAIFTLSDLLDTFDEHAVTVRPIDPEP